MNFNILLTLTLIVSTFFNNCSSYKILFLLPYNGTSHHVYYSPLIEKLAQRNNEVTVVNYLALKNMTNLRQIYLQNNVETGKRRVIMKEYYKNIPNYLRDVFILIKNVHAQKDMAKANCEKIFSNNEVLKLIREEYKFDVFILEQFYSDCGLAWASKLGIPVIGITAHVLMPWTYSRLGVPNNPAFVPHRIGNKGLWARMKAVFLNVYSNIYYRNRIQNSDHSIASNVLPGTPDLEDVARNISLVMVNQYFPLTGSRIYAPNVVEIGGMHIQMNSIQDKDILEFIESANNGVVYISFGSVACGLSEQIVKEILKVIKSSDNKFIWKYDVEDEFKNMTLPINLMIKPWIPQMDVLCHPKVVAFVTHSGMLSSIEAMHCGVPVVSIPIFGDQFANAESAKENGLGITVDYPNLNEKTLRTALEAVLQERYQSRAKYLSNLWRDRPMSPLSTAVYWVEYVARHRGAPRLRPPTVDLPLYQYLMLDVWVIITSVLVLISYTSYEIFLYCYSYNNKSQRHLKHH